MKMLIFGIILVLGLETISAHPTHRVVNGTDADIKDYPYMVSLRGPTGSHSCGASLISPEWVLCAAHCIGRLGPDYHTIQHSVANISREGPTVVPVNFSIVHEGYFTLPYIHDISLLKLAYPVNISRYSMLPSQFEDVIEDAPATLVGWGLNATGGIIMTTLQQVQLQIFSDEECAKRHNIEVFPSNICAGVPEGGKGQCSGDSGGPLLVNGRQVGAVSWSEKPCTIAPYPGVYTQVSYYREWIRQRTGL